MQKKSSGNKSKGANQRGEGERWRGVNSITGLRAGHTWERGGGGVEATAAAPTRNPPASLADVEEEGDGHPYHRAHRKHAHHSRCGSSQAVAAAAAAAAAVA